VPGCWVGRMVRRNGAHALPGTALRLEQGGRDSLLILRREGWQQLAERRDVVGLPRGLRWRQRLLLLLLLLLVESGLGRGRGRLLLRRRPLGCATRRGEVPSRASAGRRRRGAVLYALPWRHWISLSMQSIKTGLASRKEEPRAAARLAADRFPVAAQIIVGIKQECGSSF
jgi:hypothetical protein